MTDKKLDPEHMEQWRKNILPNTSAAAIFDYEQLNDRKRILSENPDAGGDCPAATCSPDRCVGSGDCVQCCPDCDVLRSYGYDDGPCERHKISKANAKM
mgnify:FL=1